LTVFFRTVNRSSLVVLVSLITLLTGAAQAQSVAAPAAQADTGFTSHVELGGTSNADGQIYELNTSAGYNFNQHFGMDVGIPMYFVRASSTFGGTSSNGVGNPYVQARVRFLNPAVNFGSALTGFAPVGDSKKGLSTGRATFDWTNHVDRSFSRLTPFAEVGVANTIADSQLFFRPYTTLGFNTHFRAGAIYDLWKFFSVGAAGYDILPAGQQTVFSRLVRGPNATAVSHGPVFQNNQQTTGGADIARDNGFSTWVDARPSRYVNLELGYTRSTHYQLNSISFVVGFNLGQWYRKPGS
jgi:hypothetical protein